MRRILLFSLAITACLLLLIVVVRPAWPSHNADVAPPRPAPAIDSPARQDAPLLVATSSPAIPDPGLPAPALAPTVITAGVETPVTITVAVGDPKLSGLKIQYTRPDGDWTTLDASPHDDGKKGDVRAGDRLFTLVVKFERKKPQTISIRARATRGGVPAFSLPASLGVWSAIKAANVAFNYPPSLVMNGTVGKPNVVAIDGGLLIDVAISANGQSPISTFRILTKPNPDHLALSDWFADKVDVYDILAPAGTYSLVSRPDGYSMLLLTGSVPSGYDGPSLPYAFIMDPASDLVASIILSQVNPLDLLGFTTDSDEAELLDSIARTLTIGG